jgi:hypothetical protein
MLSKPVTYRLWRTIAFVSAGLITIWAALAYVDDLSNRGAEIIDDYFNYVFIIGLIGVVGSFFGCIGWAKHLERSRRATMGWVVFAAPWILLTPAMLMDDRINVHGSVTSLTLLIPLALILAVVLWIMAALRTKIT